MTPRVPLRPGQLAWLAEIGLDTHWLAERPAPAPAGTGAVDADAVDADAVDADAVDAGTVNADAAVETAARTGAGFRAPSPPVPAPGPTRVRAPAGLAVPPAPAADAAAPADCPDLAALDAAVSACRRCERHGQRVRAVPGAGEAVRPYYLIVGEQPGIEDDASGRPFQGDQGRLLAAMLAAARLPQGESAYLTHVVKCRAVGGREPSAQDIAACLPWLRRQIALLRPRWILALGRVAAQAVIGTDADLDALRGGPHRHVPGQGEPIPVWVTHPPSSLLVRSAWKAEAWRDLAGLAAAVREAEAAAPRNGD
ncbi:uracil-DNA glycosylase [Castellaniella defragrans]|uniref:DNA polymerase n=2 Tax=Castellaniella defragrans TaxID=75697 RepID=A0A7W9TPA1_CASDE|nr:uracil-DNA glycosylase [Castellaniella defragrans]MBB6084413.1 DNA polymerase [Castellaniella defragrans]